jgi:hypothetical protein
LFRAESLLNTPLFVGFPGFVSKLWLAHDEQEHAVEWAHVIHARERLISSRWGVRGERPTIRQGVVTGRPLDGDRVVLYAWLVTIGPAPY